ncbi:MAG: hypothetical protein AVO35_09680 [Candidatus Aegiribacteria sp. MLS_C]|nr:MAG: hypothetical protein AVO35_09680 [Candidatus Aegiribacteria sp. MLS_C]
MRMRILLCVVVLAAAEAAVSDLVVWDYDLTELPDGWSLEGYCSEWTFSPAGAYMHAACSDPYESADAIMYTAAVLIPSGCDSVVFHVEQDLTTYSSGTGYGVARIYYRVLGQGWVEFYEGFDQTTEPIHAQIPVTVGNIVDFKIHGHAQAGSDIHPGSGSINWQLWDLTLTFYGDEVGLDHTTWASIKAMEY